MIEKHRTLLAQANAAGDTTTALGEALAVMSYTWLAECASAQQLGDPIGAVTTQYHHGVGIAGQALIQTGDQGPYVDLPMNVVSITPQTYASGFTPAFLGVFFTNSGAASSLKSAVLEQTQSLVPGMQAASTVRLVDNNANTGAKTFFADGTTSAGQAAYKSTIRPLIVPPTAGGSGNYSINDYQAIDVAITGASPPPATPTPTQTQVLAPINGQIGVGLWSGAGYTISTATSTNLSVTQKISGGLNGGFSGNNVPSPVVISNTANTAVPASGFTGTPLGATAAAPSGWGPTIAEPIDAGTGAYIYNHTDVTTGGGAFPYALSFGRTYTSSSNTADVGLGDGWTHTYSINALRSSDPFVALGEGPAAAAAASIAALVVSQDLLSTTKNAQNMTLAWMVNRWLTDQGTNNSVTVSWPGTDEQFTFSPHADGAQSTAYVAPRGSGVTLTGSVPDTYGNFTTFSYLNKDQSKIQFGAINAAATGQIASWTLPAGMAVNFAYNGAGSLTKVSNNLGRSITLTYGGSPSHLTLATDDTGRSVSYGYNGANLTRFSDPLGFQTTFGYDGAGRLTQITYPSLPGTAFVSNSYDGLGRVNAQANARGQIANFYFAGSRTETIDSVGDRHITYQTARGQTLSDAYVLSPTFGDVYNDTATQANVVNVAVNQYDGQDRLIHSTPPEGGTVDYAYSTDFLNNVVKLTRNAKSGSSLSPLATMFAYDPVYNKPTTVTDPLGLTTTMAYDGATGNLLSLINDAGTGSHFNATSRFTYSNVGQVLAAVDPLGVVTKNAYDGFGNLISTIRDSGRLNQTTSFRYNALGDLVAAVDPNLNTSTSTYDADRRLTSTTSPPAPQSRVTAYSYDPDGRLLQTRVSAVGTTPITASTTYTPTGQPATTTDANSNVTRYAYDNADRLASVTDPVGRVMAYGYDAMGRKTSVSNAAIQTPTPLVAYAYTPDGLLASFSDAAPNATGFAYDGFDRLSTTTWPNASTEVLTYDANGNVLTRKTRAGETLTYTYDTLNRLATKTPPSPAPVETYAYDLANRLTGVSDNSAAIVKPSTSASYPVAYAYDAMNRPISATWPNVPAQTGLTASSMSSSFTYDATNRRIGQSVSDDSWWNRPTAASPVAYTANALNQYTAVGSAHPTYDANGNLTNDGHFIYCYDTESRLTSVLSAGTCAAPTTTVASYAYDAQGRRKLKTVGATTTVYVTDADNREVLEYNGATGALQAWTAFGLGPDEALNQINVASSTRATLIPDVIGSIVGSLDSGGTLTKFGYQTFGENPSLTSGGYRYTGRRLDPETIAASSQPSGLYYYRARTYSPTWGRFLQPDPSGYPAGPNLYAYVNNDPLNNVDLDGLAKVEILYRPIAQTLDIASHSYVVVSESNGSNPMVFRAGPGNTGSIYAQSAPYGPGSVDYTSSPRASIVVINDNRPASYYENQLQNFQAAVNAAAIPYSPLSTNSNAFAAQAVETLGAPRPQAATFAPGYGTVLPLAPNPASGLTPSTGPGLSNPSFSSAGVSPTSTSSSSQGWSSSGSSK